MLKTLLLGIGIVAFLTVANSLESHRWDGDYLIAFLTLKECGDFGWRSLLPMAYFVIVVGAAGVVQEVLKNKRTPNQAL